MNKSMHVAVLAVLSFLLVGPVPSSIAGQPGARPNTAPGVTALNRIEVGPDDAAGYGTGTVIHADALRAGEHALVDLDVAFSGAAFSSAAAADAITNEVHRLVTPKLVANASFGRGTGLELGLGSDPVPLIGQLSQASAPQSTKLIEKVIGPIGVPPVLSVELLRSQAQARSAEGACVLGRDQAYGLGSVLKLDVLNGLVTTVARPPLREVSQSASTTRIVPGGAPGRLGLKSETRQTIAPVTFFRGTPFQFTIEVLGEWALRATADGAKASVSYGPLAASPETPIVRVLGDHGQVLGQLTTQQLLGPKGLELKIPGVAEIVIGEDPRMIDGDASSAPVVKPTTAAAAADVVRVKLINGTLADVRIGHMEAAVSVPEGGVRCPGVKVTHTVDTPTVTPGEEFVYTITVTNPNDCDLTGVKLVETPATTPAGVKYELVSSTPTGGDLSGGVVTYPDIGPLGPGETKTVTVKVKIPLGSAPGTVSALAVATGVCPAEHLPTTEVGTPPATGDIPVTGQALVEGPKVSVCVVPALNGLTLAKAKVALEAAGCTLGDVTDGGPGHPPGTIYDQGPPADTSVPIGTPVDVTLGGPLCTVPPLAGLTPAAAKTKLEDAGCKLGDVTIGPPDTPGDPGTIVTQDPPAGDKVPLATTVDVVIHPPLCVVPTLAGLTEAEAKAKLEAAGCKLGDVKPGPDNPDQAGRIVDQGPTGGTAVPQGTEVDVTVAGPVCTVPALTGMTEAAARSATEAAGCVLVTKAKTTTIPGQVGKVIDQSPEAAFVVSRGSTVNANLGVATGSQTVTRGPDAPAPPLARTGGVALAGLALWLVVGGLVTQVAGTDRLWRQLRRRTG